MKYRRHAPGIYRVSLTPDLFGQIRKHSGTISTGWSAELRKTSTGEIIRYAGIWPTREDAREELYHITEFERDAFTTQLTEQLLGRNT